MAFVRCLPLAQAICKARGGGICGGQDLSMYTAFSADKAIVWAVSSTPLVPYTARHENDADYVA